MIRRLKLIRCGIFFELTTTNQRSRLQTVVRWRCRPPVMNLCLAADRQHLEIFSLDVRRAVARAIIACPELLKVLA